MNMRCLLIYDISHDGTRTKVADACLDYGLERIQFSAFLGELSWTHQKELLLMIKRRIGKHGANIQLFPLDEKSWTSRRVFAQEEKEEENVNLASGSN
jgi:CRISPR-associated protein Cas2